MTQRYDAPGAGARLVNSALRRLAEAGISIAGSTPIRVRGRRSGAERSVVVNLLTLDGRQYLVSPRGNTQWARNVRAARQLAVGPPRRARTVRATEIGDDAKVVVLQRYLARWYWEVKGHIGGLTPQSSATRVREVAPSIPVFEVLPA